MPFAIAQRRPRSHEINSAARPAKYVDSCISFGAITYETSSHDSRDPGAADSCRFLRLGRYSTRLFEGWTAVLGWKFAIGEIYVGGTYGQTIKGGRTAHLELYEPGKGWTPLTSVVLPDIGPGSFFVTAPLGGPRKTATTIRLRITPASAFPQYDVSTHTFPLVLENVTASKFNQLDRLGSKTPFGAGAFQQAPHIIDFGKNLPKKLPPLP